MTKHPSGYGQLKRLRRKRVRPQVTNEQTLSAFELAGCNGDHLLTNIDAESIDPSRTQCGDVPAGPHT